MSAQGLQSFSYEIPAIVEAGPAFAEPRSPALTALLSDLSVTIISNVLADGRVSITVQKLPSVVVSVASVKERIDAYITGSN